ncbi:PEP-CTERM sorting domain-containing protein [Microcystis flos-aquae FACHB-1344]|uniref:PEP-CTERM sorting domain-containing protein n=1 Tax=Microcystis flos-aquae FACHB-1344 TaxID=2692899 RepID=A0ABR8HWW1_9CHRO|nr:PEP-CTERM sorting domain-containing protein [Microcystis flos-aquae FACHB-1344]
MHDYNAQQSKGLSRHHYYRITTDADTNETINSIGIRGGLGDFLIFDHLAIKTSQTTPVPEPSTILGIVTLGLGALLSKKPKRGDSNDD